MMNKGYLKATTGAEGDEVITPRYAVEPVVKHMKAAGFRNIWCPFDLEHSFFVRVLRREGFEVEATHINNGDDFFDYCAPLFDCIVSNPPFSLKDKILTRLYEMGNPFMMLLPQNALQSKVRTGLYMKHGLQYLGFDNRVHFYTRGKVREKANPEYSPGKLIPVTKENMLDIALIKKNDGYYKERPETDEEMYSKIKLQCHFASAYFCKGVLKKDLIFEHIEVIQEPYFNEEEKKKWMP